MRISWLYNVIRPEPSEVPAAHAGCYHHRPSATPVTRYLVVLIKCVVIAVYSSFPASSMAGSAAWMAVRDMDVQRN